jgi:hypothetical protein
MVIQKLFVGVKLTYNARFVEVGSPNSPEVAFWEVCCRQMPSQPNEDLAGQLLYGDSLHVSIS